MRTFLRTSSLCLFAVLALASLPVFAQTTAAPQLAGPAPSADKPTYKPTLTFDVASIRETVRGSQVNLGIINPPHKSTLTLDGLSLRQLLIMAYGPAPFQIAGGPDWADTKFFAVHANSDPSVDEKLAALPDDQARLEKQHMLQALLAGRFHMTVHWETREGSVYVMTVAKNGLKMQPAKLPVSADPNVAPTTPSTGVHAHGSRQGVEIQGERFPTRAIAQMLTDQLKTSVVDRTGDKGYYDFTLQFMRDDIRQYAAEDAYPELPVAAEEQLGLKLTPAKGPVDTLVIDHAEPLTEN